MRGQAVGALAEARVEGVDVAWREGEAAVGYEGCVGAGGFPVGELSCFAYAEVVGVVDVEDGAVVGIVEGRDGCYELFGYD